MITDTKKLNQMIKSEELKKSPTVNSASRHDSKELSFLIFPLKSVRRNRGEEKFLESIKGDVGYEIPPGTRSTSQLNKEISKTSKSSKKQIISSKTKTLKTTFKKP